MKLLTKTACIAVLGYATITLSASQAHAVLAVNWCAKARDYCVEGCAARDRKTPMPTHQYVACIDDCMARYFRCRETGNWPGDDEIIPNTPDYYPLPPLRPRR